MTLTGKGVGLAALSGPLVACGSGGGDDSPDPDDEDDDGNEGGSESALPAPSLEYKVLKRTSFGVNQATMAQINSQGIDTYLEQQLNYQTIDDGDLEAEIAERFPLIYQEPQTLLEGFPDNFGDIARDMISATQYRQMFSNRQLFEIMVDFWSNHFNIHLLEGLTPTLKPQDDQNVIRAHALGNFRDLLHASAKSPAMLFYLDNFNNRASAPNENYARELMELHTLGVDGGYTEEDIKEVARCFTGWTIGFPDFGTEYGTFSYQSAIHDDGGKVVLGNSIAPGGGQSDGETVLDILAAHPSTAQFIARKLCRRFIADEPEQSTVDAVAAAFTDSDGDISETLRALFQTDAFRSTDAAKVDRPAEFLSQLVRVLNPQKQYPSDHGQLFFFALSILGQLPFYWPTPDGYPDQQDYWVSTSGMLNRWRLSFLSFANSIPDIGVIDIDYASMLDGADSIETIIDALAEAVLMRPILDEDHQAMINWLVDTTEQQSDTSLGSAAAESVAPLVTAVLVSSAYFQQR